MSDAVNHPAHYTSNGIEVIDIIESFGLNFRLGNAIKYILRAGKKGDAKEDLRKARWYVDREIEGKRESHPTLYYLATPYSRYRLGIEAAHVDAAKLCARLVEQGHKVYSPISHCHPLSQHGGLDPLDHTLWLPYQEAMMRACDALLVAHMEGWRESKGVLHEIDIFSKAKKPIFDIDPQTLAFEPFQRFAIAEVA